MKSKIILIFIFFIPLFINAQRQYDVGVYTGVSYYMGELNPARQFSKPGRSFGLLYRYILNNRYAAKAQIVRSRLNGEISDNSSFPENNVHYKFNHKIWDFSIQAEFNFFEYNTTDMKHRYSPYVTTGISGLIFPVNLDIPIAIPVGVGFKYNYNKRVGIGMEWTFKRVFDDEWDYHGHYNANPRQTSLQNNKDWYSFVGLFLTYKFDESFECPAYD